MAAPEAARSLAEPRLNTEAMQGLESDAGTVGPRQFPRYTTRRRSGVSSLRNEMSTPGSDSHLKRLEFTETLRISGEIDFLVYNQRFSAVGSRILGPLLPTTLTDQTSDCDFCVFGVGCGRVTAHSGGSRKPLCRLRSNPGGPLETTVPVPWSDPSKLTSIMKGLTPVTHISAVVSSPLREFCSGSLYLREMPTSPSPLWMRVTGARLHSSICQQSHRGAVRTLRNTTSMS